MRDDHILDLIDGARLAELGDERPRIEAHCASCPPCLRAYRTARLSTALVEARASAVVEPSPFFHTRVMAAIRERRAGGEEYGLVRMWKAAWSLVAAMVVVVAFLAGATLVAGGPASPAPDVAAGQALYSPEWERLEGGAAGEEQLSDVQFISVLYESEAVNAVGQ
jgi:hypothetical protein